MNHLKIALTGGIGTGKSFVCRSLERRGIGVYDADAAAKRLMLTNPTLQRQLSQLIGCEAVVDGRIEKRRIAEFLLASADNKLRLNDVVHPYVASDFKESDFRWMETAILYESGFYKRVDFGFVVSVSAPDSVRTARVAVRDHLTVERASEWVRAQMPQQEIDQRADFVVQNDGIRAIEPQIDRLLHAIEKREEEAAKRQKRGE